MDKPCGLERLRSATERGATASSRENMGRGSPQAVAGLQGEIFKA